MAGSYFGQMTDAGKADYVFAQIPLIGELSGANARTSERIAHLQAQEANAFAAAQADKAMAFSAEQAQISRDWQEQMTNTAYQRAVEDMRKAGLNPYLAYNNGGAQSGSGSAASGIAASPTRASAVQAGNTFISDIFNGVAKIVSELIPG